MPGKGRTNTNVVGAPFYPYFMAKTGALFLFTFAATALAAALVQVNPIWLYGPYSPATVSAGSQPDFYMGWLEGALRMSPSWTWDLAGHTVAWDVFVAALVVPGLFFTAAAAWPFLERWITGDRAAHRRDPHRGRQRRDHLLGDLVGRGRQRRDRRPPGHLAVRDHRDRPLRHRHRPGRRLRRDQADLPRPAAQGPAAA